MAEDINQKMTALALARAFRERAALALGQPIEVILYGSQARGQATPESDVDLLAVVPDLERGTLDALFEIAWEIGFGAGVVLSVIPVAVDELDLLTASPFMRAVHREGLPV